MRVLTIKVLTHNMQIHFSYKKIDIQGEVVKDFETMMKSKFLVPLFLGYLRDRVEFNHFLEINPISSQIN